MEHPQPDDAAAAVPSQQPCASASESSSSSTQPSTTVVRIRTVGELFDYAATLYDDLPRLTHFLSAWLLQPLLHVFPQECANQANDAELVYGPWLNEAGEWAYDPSAPNPWPTVADVMQLADKLMEARFGKGVPTPLSPVEIRLNTVKEMLDACTPYNVRRFLKEQYFGFALRQTLHKNFGKTNEGDAADAAVTSVLPSKNPFHDIIHMTTFTWCDDDDTRVTVTDPSGVKISFHMSSESSSSIRCCIKYPTAAIPNDM